MGLHTCQNCGEETAEARCPNCGATVRGVANARTSGPPRPAAASNLPGRGTQPRRPAPKPRPPSDRTRKERYLSKIRDESAYPTFRTLNEAVAGLLILFGIVILLLAVFVSLQDGSQ